MFSPPINKALAERYRLSTGGMKLRRKACSVKHRT
jgi:hypothetical protein